MNEPTVISLSTFFEANRFRRGSMRYPALLEQASDATLDPGQDKIHNTTFDSGSNLSYETIQNFIRSIVSPDVNSLKSIDVV